MLGVSMSITSVPFSSSVGVFEMPSFEDIESFRGIRSCSGFLCITDDAFGLDAMTFVSPSSIELGITLLGGNIVFSTSMTAGDSLIRFLLPTSSTGRATLLPVAFWTLFLTIAFGAGLRGLGAIGVADSSSLDGTSNTLAFRTGTAEGDGLFLGLFSRIASKGITLGDLDGVGTLFFSGDCDWRKRVKLCSGIRLRTAFPYVAILFLGRETITSSWPAIVNASVKT